MNRNWNRPLGNVLFATLLIAFSYYYLDRRIASVVSTVVSSHDQLAIFSATIPDLLGLIACVITGIAGIASFAYTNKGINNTNSRFFLLMAYTVPLSFLLKSILQCYWQKQHKALVALSRQWAVPLVP
jgi:hypothetical protein